MDLVTLPPCRTLGCRVSFLVCELWGLDNAVVFSDAKTTLWPFKVNALLLIGMHCQLFMRSWLPSLCPPPPFLNIHWVSRSKIQLSTNFVLGPLIPIFLVSWTIGRLAYEWWPLCSAYLLWMQTKDLSYKKIYLCEEPIINLNLYFISTFLSVF